MREIDMWFCCMPGVTVHLLRRRRPAAVLAHPNMPAAMIDLETGELVELHCMNWYDRTDLTNDTSSYLSSRSSRKP